MPKIALVILSVLGIIVFLFLIVSFISSILFEQKVYREVSELFSEVESRSQIVQPADLAGLPHPVQKWLQYSQVIGKERISTVRLKQKVELRLKEGQQWMHADAEQYFTVEKPGFIWKAKIKAAPLLHIAGRDKYQAGMGNMLIKALSLITVADASGEEIDQGTLLRYLAETVWFPTAALSSYITWEEIDANSAKVTMSYGGITASGIFTFNEKGEIINFVAKRYGEFDGQYRLETWSVPVQDYREFNGIKVPTRGQVIWKLESGDFNWYHFEVTEIEYNKPVVY
ncbi:DUF6544 family protein [Moorella sulfitireducens]|uniref:DUF6544 family protein n=1 Tax=Neomoorella sulfitireducens TaxID=2972948 RepID=UPI0021ACC895|nr:DUF6544 family protein [Moorella sulfitireducens]